MNAQQPSEKKRAGADLVIPVGASLYAVYYIASVWDFPAEAQQSGIFLAGLLLGLSALFFAKTAVTLARGQARWDFSALLGAHGGRRARFAFAGLTVAYIFVVPYGGFTLTTFVLVFLGSLLAGLRSLRRALVFATVVALSGWLFFIVALGTRFPRGPFEQLVSLAAASWN